MNDETDLLRAFRRDVPEASPRAWEKSRAAIEAVAAAEHQPGRRIRSFLPALASAAAVMILVAGVLLLHGVGPGTHPASRQPASSGQWRPSGLLTTGRGVPAPASLTCPTASVCYAVSDGATTAPVLYASQDGARSWSATAAPASMTFTSPLSCWSALACAAGATSSGSPVLAVTSDGGRTWSFTSLPAADGKVFVLDCWAAGACHGLASASRVSVFGFASGTRFVTISGRQVTSHGFAGHRQIQDMACPAPGYCVAAGTTYVPVTSTSRSAQSLPGVVQVSSDGGQTWREASVPRGFRLASTGYSISCPSSRACLANSGATGLIASADGGLTWRYIYRVARGGPVIAGITCPAVRSCQAWGRRPVAGQERGIWAATVLSSGDGGITWTGREFPAPDPLPAGVTPGAYSNIYDVSCPGHSFCAALGGPAPGSAATPVFTLGP